MSFERIRRVALLTVILSYTLWILSVSVGIYRHAPEKTDLAGQIVGSDFIMFYRAGKILREEGQSRLYDQELHRIVSEEVSSSGYHGALPFFHSPLVALFYEPLSLLSLECSLLAWEIFSLACLLAAYRLIADVWNGTTLIYLFSFYPVFANFSFGQNSAVGLLIMTSSYLLLSSKRPLLGGLILSLLIVKPQFIIGVGVALILTKNFRAIVGLMVGALLSTSISYFMFPDATISHWSFILGKAPNLELLPGFPLIKQHSFKAFWILLLNPYRSLISTLTVACQLAGLVTFSYAIYRNREKPRIAFALGCMCTFAITPYAMVYDLTLLILPALILWQECAQLRVKFRNVFVVAWLGIWLGITIITPLESLYLPFAVHVSELTVLLSIFYLLYLLKDGVDGSPTAKA